MTTSSNRGHLEVYAKALGGEERRGEGRRRVGGGGYELRDRLHLSAYRMSWKR
jgi:hypothetical protein